MPRMSTSVGTSVSSARRRTAEVRDAGRNSPLIAAITKRTDFVSLAYMSGGQQTPTTTKWGKRTCVASEGTRDRVSSISRAAGPKK